MACLPTGGPAPPLVPPRLTVAEVLRAALPEYAATHRLPAQHWKIMNALLACRTARLGGHVYRCLDCGQEHFVPHSCRNRHCPACQRALAEEWLAQQEAQLLPVPYFHVVFTLPHGLNPLIQQNQRVCYNLLFQAASQTLLTFGEERFHAQLGVTAVLHTWSQTLGDHYHLHCLVTGGGWDQAHGRWRSSGRRYLFPVRALSAVFRGKYLAGCSGSSRTALCRSTEAWRPWAPRRPLRGCSPSAGPGRGWCIASAPLPGRRRCCVTSRAIRIGSRSAPGACGRSTPKRTR